jgi:hypothetical protein
MVFHCVLILHVLFIRSRYISETSLIIRKLAPLTVFFLGLLAFPHCLRAQGTDLGAIRGTVADPSGAKVPHAHVEITDLNTQITRTYESGDHGGFDASALPSGQYKVAISAPGFGTSIVQDVTVSGSNVATADVVLRPSSVDQSVQVTSEALTIDTQDPTLNENLTPTAIIELPRDSRDIYSFMYINPNVTQSGVSGDFKFIGAQSYGAEFSVDGQRANGGIFGSQTQSKPSLESVGEFNVLSNGFSAEYAGIASVRVSTKRGGADYHGSAFYNNKNSALAAWTLADKNAEASFAPSPFQAHYPNPYFNITDSGESAGGPVPRLGKTFFFAAYEHNWTIQPNTTGRVNNLPHPAVIAGDFSGVEDSAKPDVPAGTILTPSEIANDTVGGLGQKFITIPTRLLNSYVQKLFSTYYPQVGMSAPEDPATGRVIGYQTSIPAHSGQNLGDLRVDHDFSDSNRIYGVYHGGSENDALNEVAAPLTGLGLSQTDRLNKTLSLSYTHIFGPRLVNEARGGFNRQYLFTHSNTTLRGFLSSIGFSDADVAAYGSTVGANELDTFGQAAINITNFQGVGNGGRNTNRPLSQNLITFGDTMTWNPGRHNIRFGADLVRNSAEDGFTSGRGQPRGLMTYTGSGTSALAKLLLGDAPDSVSYTPKGRPAMDVYNWETGIFMQDDFRLNERLTLNFGLRYDLFTPFTETNDLMVNFDPTLTNPVTGLPGTYIMPSKKTLNYVDPSVIAFGYVLASSAGVGRSLVHTDWSDVNPRVGFAYKINDKSVARGGYGVFTPTSTAHVIRDPLATNTFNQTYTLRSAAGGAPLNPWPTPGEGAGTSPNTGGTASGFGNTPTANNVPLGLKNPRLQQWNATFEQQLASQWTARLSYIGAYITGEVTGRDLDMIAPSDNLFGVTTGDGVTICDPANLGDCAYSPQDNARLRFPALGDYITAFGNNGHGLTASWQAQIQRQAKHLTLSVAYTYLDQKSTGVDADQDSLGGDAYNQLDPNSDYGTDSFVSRHRLVSYGVVDLPFGRGERFGSKIPKLLDTIVGGWQTTFNMFAKTGTGFTPFYYCNDCDPVFPGNIASGAVDAVGDFSGGFRARVIGNPKHGAGSNEQWNAAAFDLPPTGATLFSDPLNAKRNSLIGPGTYGVNLGIHKTFSISERVGVQIGADADNVFNHPLLSPDSNSSDDFANVGSFTVHLDPNTGAILPLATEYYPNPDFGLKYQSVTQEGIDNRRSIRLRGRITF